MTTFKRENDPNNPLIEYEGEITDANFSLECNYEELDLRFKVTFNTALDKFDLRVNEQPYEDLPYISPTCDLSSTQVELLQGRISINDKILIQKLVAW